MECHPPGEINNYDMSGEVQGVWKHTAGLITLSKGYTNHMENRTKCLFSFLNSYSDSKLTFQRAAFLSVM